MKKSDAANVDGLAATNATQNSNDAILQAQCNTPSRAVVIIIFLLYKSLSPSLPLLVRDGI